MSNLPYMWRCIFVLFIFSSLELPVACSQYPIPTTWTGSTSTLPRDARFQVAQDALELLLSQVHTSAQIQDLISLNNEAAASATWVTVLQDYFSSSTANEVQATANIVSGQAMLSSLTLNSDLLYWGLVNSYAFRAYNKSLFLNIATDIWNDVTPYFVLPQPASSSQYNKSVPIQLTCNGATTAGGVFWDRESTNNLQVNAETIGTFTALSSYLFEATQNATYLSYAQLATAFIQAHLFDGQVIGDTIDIGSCAVTPSTNSSTVWSYDSGLVIEAWSVLADATQNDTLRTIRDGLVYTSATSAIWTNLVGVNFEKPGPKTDGSDHTGGFKAFYVRGLHTAWMRSDPVSDIAQFIAAYITIQYNALLSQASQPNIYSDDWFGGSASSFQTYPQAIALHVLSPAITLAESSSSNTSTPNVDNQPNQTQSGIQPTSKSSPGNKTNVSTGAKAGIVAGAITSVCCLAAMIAFLVLRKRKRARQAADTILQDASPPSTIEPFTPLLSTTAAGEEPPAHPRHRSKGLEAAFQQPIQPRPLRHFDEHLSRSSSERDDAMPRSRQQPDTTDMHRVSQTILTLLHALQTRDLHSTPSLHTEPPQYEP